MSLTRVNLFVLLVLPLCPTVRGGPGIGKEALFADTLFRRGFLLSYANSSKGRAVEAVLHLDDPNNVPLWRLCQWGTKHTLATACCVRNRAGNLSYENEAKKVVVGSIASHRGELTLQVRGRAEYGARARESGQSWPHLLVEQDAVKLRPLDALSKIQLRISVRLLHCMNHTAEDQYDPGLHAAQFQMFFIVRNTNPTSDDRGDYFWFGVPFYDSRHDIPPAYKAKDSGKTDATSKFIYTVAGKAVGLTSLKPGQWVRLQVDVLPHIKRGLKEAVERGYLESRVLHDYAVANVNLGWEVPGTFDAAMQIKDFSVLADLKGNLDSPTQ